MSSEDPSKDEPPKLIIPGDSGSELKIPGSDSIGEDSTIELRKDSLGGGDTPLSAAPSDGDIKVPDVKPLDVKPESTLNDNAGPKLGQTNLPKLGETKSPSLDQGGSGGSALGPSEQVVLEAKEPAKKLTVKKTAPSPPPPVTNQFPEPPGGLPGPGETGQMNLPDPPGAEIPDLAPPATEMPEAEIESPQDEDDFSDEEAYSDEPQEAQEDEQVFSPTASSSGVNMDKKTLMLLVGGVAAGLIFIVIGIFVIMSFVKGDDPSDDGKKPGEGTTAAASVAGEGEKTYKTYKIKNYTAWRFTERKVTEMVNKPDLLVDDQSFTVEYWLRFVEQKRCKRFEVENADKSSQFQLYITRMTDGSHRAYFKVKRMTTSGSYFKLPKDINGWIHVAGVYDKGEKTIQVYVNGEPGRKVKCRKITPLKVDSLRIQCSMLGSGGKVLVDDLRLTRKAVYTSSFDPGEYRDLNALNETKLLIHFEQPEDKLLDIFKKLLKEHHKDKKDVLAKLDQAAILMNAASYGDSFTDVNLNASDLHIVDHADFEEIENAEDIAVLKEE